jgi:hypothetical protein
MTAMDTRIQISTSGFFPGREAPAVRLQVSCPRSCKGECDSFTALLLFILNTGGIRVEPADSRAAFRKVPVFTGKFHTSAADDRCLFQGLLVDKSSGAVLWYMTITFLSVKEIEGKVYLIFRKMFDTSLDKNKN